MASQEQIAELRELINEPDATNGWTDDKLAAIIDGQATMNAAASAVWSRKAAAFSTLVDVSESGSSRKLSDLHKNALTMADRFTAADGGSGNTTDAPVIQRIRRGF